MIQRTLIRSLRNATRQPQPLRLTRATQNTPLTASRSAAPSATQQLAGRRWYSQEAEAKKDETAAEQADAQGLGDKATSQASKADDPLQKDLEAKNKEVVELTDRVKRSIAEYRNLQEQTKREVQAARDFALQRFAKDLLDSVDNLDRALANVPTEKLTEENKDLVNLHSGLKMTEDILMSTLKRHGMERFDPAESSDKFDPNKMEATFQAPQQGKEDGTVFYTQQKGFTLNGRVLRAAKVGVVQNS
ncbi:hypothetical protein LTR36_010628 [Oleoguttula mirabilis]|uniref:GrpE protein homolog n=1 Tax=Oleoguttula mirabilis TaxID=1507867 RepID=A0AAV9JQN1_9PEZI|nr:hypothetical protein LTR36_010628 [Oleoguttula mirabilis]